MSEVEIKGVVEDVVFRNEDNGYTVMYVSGENELVTCVGIAPEIHSGETVIIKGRIEEHREFGTQIKIQSVYSELPTNLDDIEKYLASGIIKGIGPATAMAIVRHFGTDTLNVLETTPHRLNEIPGIGSQRAAQIALSYRENVQSRDTMMFLKSFGISTALALKIYKVYGDKTKETILANPYSIVSDVDGIGFVRADTIARQLGVKTDSPYRVKAAMVYLLNEAAVQNGHVFLPAEVLISQVGGLIGGMEFEAEDILNELEYERKIVRDIDNGNVYLSVYYHMEVNVAFSFAKLMRSARVLPVDISAELDAYQAAYGIELANMQREAVTTAINNGVVVITGGPGTGKTTIIKCITSLLERRNLKYALAAPTGRAAKRMAESTGVEASTIHRLLGYSKNETGHMVFKRNEDEPLGEDVIIIDEMSMVDLTLMHALVKALPAGTRLIMVGDADQLPSVGAGNVLKDIISSARIPVICLKDIYRQQNESLIIYNAHRINKGEMPVFNNKSSDFLFLNKFQASEISDTVIDLCARRIPNYYNVDPVRDIQVLAPMKKNAAGVNDINIRMQQRLNPPCQGKKEYAYSDTVFREGDKVMQIKNNYDIEWIRALPDGEEKGEGIYNGDCGIIEKILQHERIMVVRFDDGKRVDYDFSMLDDLVLAYAVTVHKSQGCEFDFVVLPLAGGSPMLYSRNLLYTAVTRAKKMVLIVGREHVIKQMVNNAYTAVRYSFLCNRIQEYMNT